MSDPTRYKDIIDNLYDGVYFVNRDRVITYWNKGAERITGYLAAEVVGRACRDNLLNHVTADGEALCTSACPLTACMAASDVREADVFLHHADGHRVPVLVRCAPLHDGRGEVVGAVETFSRDLGTVSARRELRELRRTARTDPLTGIGNRTLVEDRLRALVAEYAHGGAGVALLDIDHFKQVNDTHGHDAGDRVLRMVAATLRHNLRATDVVGRWGGEEFVLLLHDLATAEEAVHVCDKVRTLIRCSRLDLPGAEVAVTVSIGATLLRPGDAPDDALRRADEAMYRSKNAGRDRVTVL